MRTREGDAEAFLVGGGHLGFEDEVPALHLLVDDLIEMLDLCRGAGAQGLLLTYAQNEGIPMISVNMAIRRAHYLTQEPLLDQGRYLKGVLAEFGEERLLFRDAHPRREGYEVLARFLYQELLERDLIQGPDLGEPDQVLRERGGVLPQLRVLPIADRLAVECSYEPGLSYSLLLSRARGPAFERWGRTVELGQDDLFLAAFDDGALHGVFGPEGRAVVEVPRKLLSGAESGPVFGVLLVRTRDWTPIALSATTRLR